MANIVKSNNDFFFRKNYLCIMRVFIFLFVSLPLLSQELIWTHNSPIIRSYSSPRTVDLNNDGTKDVIIGGGVDGYPTPYGVNAIDGANGNTLWTVTTRNEMFTSPQFFDYTNDNVDDIIIGGRDAELRLINGANGEVIWEFWDDENTNPNDFGWYNFYTSQIIEDQTGDNMPDILVSNGGDHSLDFSELNRPPGHILIIDGMNGNAFKTAVVPDSNETYMSPLLCDLNGNNNFTVILGTGGEGVAGNLWAVSLDDLLNEDITTNAIPLVPNSELGHIAPPSLGDLNNDNILDIVTQGFDGQLTAIDGANYNILWQYKIENTESSAAPIIGKFSQDDDNLDVFATIFSGIMSSYNDYYQVLLDGETGNVLWTDSLGLINFCSPIAFDSNLDDKDEVLISVINNNGNFFENELLLIDFINSTTSTFFGPIAGGNIASTPQICDLDSNGSLDVVFALQGDSLDPFGDGTFYEYGVNTIRLATDYTLPESEIGWASYMGSEFNGEYNDGCEGALGLFAFPSEICPGENNGAINLYVSEGIPPYTYLWSNGATTEDLENLEPGIYTVTVTDATGACDIISREIFEYSTVSFYEPPTCNGGSDGIAYFNSTGCDCNTSFCQFIWELNGDTIANGDGSTADETYKYLFDITAGTYTATIIHPDGCEVQQEIIVPNPTIIDSTFVMDECVGDSSGLIELINFEEDSLQTYIWNTGDTTKNIYNLSEGSYSVIVSDTLCTDTLSFEIENFEYINGSIEKWIGGNVGNPYELIGIDPDTLFLGDSCYAYNQYRYIFDEMETLSNAEYMEWGQLEGIEWNISGGNQGEVELNEYLSCSGDWCFYPTSYVGQAGTGPIVMPLFMEAGTYTLSVYNNLVPWSCVDNGIQIDIVVIDNLNACSSIGVDEFKHSIVTNSNNIYVDLHRSNRNYLIELFDIQGKKIYMEQNQNGTIYINTDKFTSGLYTIRIMSNENTHNQRILINR